MTGRKIELTEAALDRLSEHSRPDETLSETVVRLTTSHEDKPDRGEESGSPGERCGPGSNRNREAGTGNDVLAGFAAMADVDGFRDAVETAREEFGRNVRRE